jgi:RHS repeat-associated protein
VVDGLGRLTKIVEDPVVAGQNPGGTPLETFYAYDAQSNLTGVAQGVQARSFSYSSLSRLVSATNPESGTVSYGYDDNGNLTRRTDARGVVKQFSPYDALNRPTQWNFSGTALPPGSTTQVTYAYGTAASPCGSYSVGGLCSASSKIDNSTAVFSSTSYAGYDPLGRVGNTTQTVQVLPASSQSYSLSHSYNLAGGVTSTTYPSEKIVVTQYDPAGRVAGVSNATGSFYYAGALGTDAANRIQYAAHGAIQQMKLGNPLWEDTRFNSRLQPLWMGVGQTATLLTTETLSTAASNRLLLGYGYGSTTNNGNMVSQSIHIGSAALTQSYSYDALNRLATANESSSGAPWSQTYSYDRFGNRAVTAGSEHGPNPIWTPTALSHFDASTNRLVGLSEYDAAGNLTKDNVGRQFKYDGENKQVEFNPGAGLPVTKYFYDADGRRVKKETSGEVRAFVYNAQGQLAAEYTNGSATGSGTSYLTTDHLGSTRIVTDATGNPKTRHDYLPFGEEIPLISTNYGNRLSIPGYTASPIDGPHQKFTAKERDSESGLDYFLARYYSGAQGRFTSPDVAGPDLLNPQTLNKYRYGLNNPLRYIDPNGLYEEDVHRDLHFALGVAAGLVPRVAGAVASANQWVDDDPATTPFRLSPESRHNYHFTTQSRRDELWRVFLSTGSPTDLGIFSHPFQDAFSHSAFEAYVGHFHSRAPDKTYNNPEKADQMAEATYNTLVTAATVMQSRGQVSVVYAPLPWKVVRPYAQAFNRARTPEEKARILSELNARAAENIRLQVQLQAEEDRRRVEELKKKVQ